MEESALSPVERTLVETFMDAIEQVLGPQPTPQLQMEAINAAIYFVVAAARAAKLAPETALALRRATALLEGGL